MTDLLLRQGLQIVLEGLETKRQETLGAIEDVPRACADCYALEEECCCRSPILWPLPAVVYKLRAELSFNDEA